MSFGDPLPLLAQLHSDDARERAAAATQLGVFGYASAVPALIAAVHDPDPQVQRSVLQALGWLKEPAAIPALLSVGHTAAQPRGTREEAFLQLSQCGEPALLPLLSALMTFQNANLTQTPEASALCGAVVYGLGYMGDLRAVPYLRAVLTHPVVWVRYAAAVSLGWLGDASAVEPLVHLLGTDGHAVMSASAEALAAIGDTHAIDPLVHILTHPDAERRERVKDALITFGPAAVDPLLVLLTSRTCPDQTTTLAILGEIGDTRAVEPLMRILRADPLPQNRVAAAESLGKLGDPRAVASLVAASTEDSEEVAVDAIFALGRLQHPDAVTALFALCQTLGDDRRFLAIDALGWAGDRRAIAPLLNRLESGPAADRSTLIEALGMFEDPALIAPIAAWLGDPDLTHRALVALGNQKNPRIWTYILPYLDHADADIRQCAVAALQGCGTTPVREHIVAKLVDDSAEVRFAAAVILAHWHDPRGLPILFATLDHRSHSWQGRAVAALAALGDRRAIAPLFAAAVAQPLLRTLIAQALFALGDERGVPLLVSQVSNVLRPEMRGTAAEILGEIGDTRVVGALQGRNKDYGLYRPERAQSRFVHVRDSVHSALERIEHRERELAFS